MRLGGHDVPESVVRRRYVTGLHAFFTVYREIADAWQLLDTSELGAPRLIAAGGADIPTTIADEQGWNLLLEQSR